MPNQKFECEECGIISEDVYHHEETGIAMCSDCIKKWEEENSDKSWMEELTPRELLMERALRAVCKAYNLPDPRTDADGPDIDFQMWMNAALDRYDEQTKK